MCYRKVGFFLEERKPHILNHDTASSPHDPENKQHKSRFSTHYPAVVGLPVWAAHYSTFLLASDLAV